MQTGVKLRPVRAGEPLFGLPAIALESLACVYGVQPCPEQSTGERFVVACCPCLSGMVFLRLMSVSAIGALGAEGHPRSLRGWFQCNRLGNGPERDLAGGIDHERPLAIHHPTRTAGCSIAGRIPHVMVLLAG